MQQLSLFPFDADSALQGSARDQSRRLYGVPSQPAVPGTDQDKARQLDQFFTRDEVAEELFDRFLRQFSEHDVGTSKPTRFLEPSAGKGAFSRLLPPGSFALDIDPQGPGIVQGDFLDMTLPTEDRWAVIGNPPFGKNASMAIKFFNHAAGAAGVIALIVPRTFQKVSVQNRLDLSFHLIDEMPVPKDAFIFEGKRKHVPAVFQIWVKKDVRRPMIVLPITLPKVHADFEFLRAEEVHKANFAIQRVGAKAGQVHHNLEAKPSAHYFVRATPGIADLEDAMNRLRLDFEAMARRTAGKPSLAKTEVVQLYTQFRTSRSDEPEARP